MISFIQAEGVGHIKIGFTEADDAEAASEREVPDPDPDPEPEI
ncbi:MAG TPA: hypothetical protein VKE74_19475 [Gemmataceae bacterium]|nr:hypothetical protein [Gemmataceae bacterium]